MSCCRVNVGQDGTLQMWSAFDDEEKVHSVAVRATSAMFIHSFFFNMRGFRKEMSPYLCIYIQRRYRNETKHKIQLPCVRILFVLLIFALLSLWFDKSLPALSKFFEPVGAEIFTLFLKPFLHHTCIEFLWFVSWKMPTTKNVTVPKPGCMEGAEQLQIRCILSLLNWQY